jgi:hypothetical protein
LAKNFLGFRARPWKRPQSRYHVGVAETITLLGVSGACYTHGKSHRGGSTEGIRGGVQLYTQYRYI